MFQNYPNGVSSGSLKKNENRYFQDLVLTSYTGKFNFNNRLRFEQRVIEKIENNEIMVKRYF